MRSRLRPFLAIILSLVLVIGLVVHAAQAAQMTLMMVAGTACMMPGQDHCPGDGNGRVMHRSSCDMFCAGAVALMPMLAGAMVMIAGSYIDAAPKQAASVTAAPDPSPPRRSS